MQHIGPYPTLVCPHEAAPSQTRPVLHAMGSFDKPHGLRTGWNGRGRKLCGPIGNNYCTRDTSSKNSQADQMPVRWRGCETRRSVRWRGCQPVAIWDDGSLLHLGGAGRVQRAAAVLSENPYMTRAPPQGENGAGILIGVNRKVYDVSVSQKFYGPGC